MITLATKIKIELLKKGIAGAEIARRCGVTRAAIYHVIEGRVRSHRLRSAIAKAIEIPLKELWPDDGRKKAA